MGVGEAEEVEDGGAALRLCFNTGTLQQRQPFVQKLCVGNKKSK